MSEDGRISALDLAAWLLDRRHDAIAAGTAEGAHRNEAFREVQEWLSEELKEQARRAAE